MWNPDRCVLPMNATSRTILIAMLTTDPAFSTAERQTVLQLINGETQCGFTSPEAAARLLVPQKSAAELLSVSRVTIWRMKRDGRLNPVEILPGTWRYRYSEIAEIARGGGYRPRIEIETCFDGKNANYSRHKSHE